MAAIPFASQCWNRSTQAECGFAWSCKIEAQDHQSWISEPDIIERLVALDCHVSPEQLARWRGKRLLLPAFQPGQGQGKGRASALFHPVTVNQAARIKTLLRERMDFGPIGWRLWCEGYLVGDEYWKPIIERASARWGLFREKMDKILDSDDDIQFSELEAVIQIIFRMRSNNIILKSLRSTLNSQRFSAFVMASLTAAAAGYHRNIDQNDFDDIEDNKSIDLAFSIVKLKNSGGERIFQGTLSDIFDHISVSMKDAHACFIDAYQNDYVRGRIYFNFLRDCIAQISYRMSPIPKLFVRIFENRKSPEADAILIALLPIVLEHLEKAGEVQPAMARVIQLTRSVIGFEQNENGPKWLIP